MKIFDDLTKGEKRGVIKIVEYSVYRETPCVYKSIVYIIKYIIYI